MPAPLSRATAGRNDYIGAEADDVAALPPGDQAARQSAAKRLREKYPRWVWYGLRAPRAITRIRWPARVPGGPA